MRPNQATLALGLAAILGACGPQGDVVTDDAGAGSDGADSEDTEGPVDDAGHEPLDEDVCRAWEDASSPRWTLVVDPDFMTDPVDMAVHRSGAVGLLGSSYLLVVDEQGTPAALIDPGATGEAVVALDGSGSFAVAGDDQEGTAFLAHYDEAFEEASRQERGYDQPTDVFPQGLRFVDGALSLLAFETSEDVAMGRLFRLDDQLETRLSIPLELFFFYFARAVVTEQSVFVAGTDSISLYTLTAYDSSGQPRWSINGQPGFPEPLPYLPRLAVDDAVYVLPDTLPELVLTDAPTELAAYALDTGEVLYTGEAAPGAITEAPCGGAVMASVQDGRPTLQGLTAAGPLGSPRALELEVELPPGFYVERVRDLAISPTGHVVVAFRLGSEIEDGGSAVLLASY